jgi:hypothetical protein
MLQQDIELSHFFWWLLLANTRQVESEALYLQNVGPKSESYSYENTEGLEQT